MQRVLGRLGRGGPGTPTLIVVGGLHGNEPAGVEAARRVGRVIAPREGRLRGSVVFVGGNLQALALGRRFVDRDLNRVWTPRAVAELRRRSPALDTTEGFAAEDVEQRELLAVFDEALRKAEGPVYVLDLHTTSGDGGPFTTVADALPNREVALHLPVPLVLGLEELVDGTLHEYLATRDCITVAFEAGRHDEPAAIDRAEAGIWILLAATGIAPETDFDEVGPARERLRRETAHLPRVLEMRHRHPVRPDDAFRMHPGYTNFQRIRRGEILAEDRNGSIRAPETARILMPLYQVQGEDGFFVVRAFNRFWLGVSRTLRHLGADRWVHWLPGIRLHPDRPEARIVNRRVARFYALQLLHLLGYRRHEEDGPLLIVVRQGGRSPG